MAPPISRYRVLTGADVLVPVPVTTVADPTAGAVNFATSSMFTYTPGSFDQTGSWGTWDADQNEAVAVFDFGATSLTAGEYRLYVQFTVGTETPSEYVGVLEVI